MCIWISVKIEIEINLLSSLESPTLITKNFSRNKQITDFSPTLFILGNARDFLYAFLPDDPFQCGEYGPVALTRVFFVGAPTTRGNYSWGKFFAK